ncbi:hypothetical protein BDR03DRAFT_969904 [Suillus americanus]|nr:hypothetical protein BDR03DRAFT_969904 [Suillus americanus]
MAWFLAFPTYQEHVLWRISAVAITGLILLAHLSYCTSQLVPSSWYSCSPLYAIFLLTHTRRCRGLFWYRTYNF